MPKPPEGAGHEEPRSLTHGTLRISKNTTPNLRYQEMEQSRMKNIRQRRTEMTNAVIKNDKTAFMATITPPVAQKGLMKEEHLGMIVQE